MLCAFHSTSQSIDSLSLVRSKQIITSTKVDTLVLEKNSLVPNSLIISNKADHFEVNYSSSAIYEIVNDQQIDTITIQYRVFPFSFTQEDTGISEYKANQADSIEDVYVIGGLDSKQDIFDFGDLKIDGGLGRALNFGNNQNLVVNSNLNLRLSGTVAGDVKVVGVLTDSNVPFQPQGNSQQIRELDQVFLQFSKDEHQITMGDYEYRKPTSYFLNFDKRLQGVNYMGEFATDNGWQITTSNSGAVSRGKYALNQFVGTEGNQGPYKLFGANNESFIIILAGTEQVFIDGVKQERGQDRDYIIDYNTGEITFMSRQMITNRSRIAIEFEYTDQSYNSSLLFSETKLQKDKLSFRVNVYTEQDSKNRIQLSDTTLNTAGLFSTIGDTREDFLINSARAVNFNGDRIQYKLVADTVVNNTIHENVYVYSRNADLQLYNVIFTYVGNNNGDYRLTNTNTNGRVYEWIAPENGVHFGNYVAEIRLKPPSQQQMASITTAYQFSKNHSLSIETSLSNRDLNTLSELGNDDNQGFATKLGWNKQFNIGQDSTKNKLIASINYEWKGKQFRPIERYRPIEFSRDWNANTNATDSLAEGYGSLQLNYLIDDKKSLGYNLSTFNQQNLYDGLKQRLTARVNDKGWTINSTVDYLTASQTSIESSFFRPNIQVEKQLNKLTLGSRLQQNVRKFEQTNTGILSPNSIGDEDYSIYLSTADSTKLPITVSYNKHFDSTPSESQLSKVFEADEWKLTGALRQSKMHRANFTFTYRNLAVLDTTLTNEKGKNSLLGKFNYAGNFLQGVVRTGFDYEIGSGREPKREFSYIQVANGEGVYTWIDYNNNGVQELTEFEVAPFSDQAAYVRVFTNTNEYINADTGRLNQWLQIEPALAWRDKEGFKLFMSRFSASANLTLNSKQFENAAGTRFNPYTFSVNKEGLVASNNRLSAKMIYNKLSNKFRTSYLYQENDTKSQLLSGFEQREKREHLLNTTIYFKNKLTLQLESGMNNNSFFSENYSQKTFEFDQYFGRPKLSWVLNNELRVSSEYQFTNSKNLEVFGGQTATSNAAKLDFNWNKKKKFALQGKFSYDAVSYNGNTNDAVSFSMLNGLQKGKNLLWNLGFERSVLESLRVNLTYDGRKLGEYDPVHTGRARITAIF